MLNRRQQKSRHKLERMLREINTRSPNIAPSRKLRDEAKQNLKDFLDSHGFFAGASSGQKSQFLIMNIVPLCIYVLDFLMCSAVAEYISRMANLSEKETILSRILIPLMFIGLEVTNEALRLYHSEELSGRGKHRLISTLFLCVAILLAIAMPCLFVSTMLASRFADPSPLPWPIFITILASLSILNFSGHVIMLFSSMAVYEAKSYLFFLIGRRKLSRRYSRCEEALQREERWLIDYFQSYCQQVERHNRLFEEKLGHGPFTETARETINGLFGHEVIPRPSKKKGDGDDDGGSGTGGESKGGDSSIHGASDKTGHHDDSEPEEKTSTDDREPIFTPTDSEWDPFKK